MIDFGKKKKLNFKKLSPVVLELFHDMDGFIDHQKTV
jgi:hypothetical protein